MIREKEDDVMNYTIHLTGRCNLRCKYCYENKKDTEASFDNIKALIDNEIKSNSNYSVITFYGGEPLLRKDLIYQTIDYINSKDSQTKFYFGMTTNGMLMDEEFIQYIKENEFVSIAYSFDGTKDVQNLNRITVDR